jgi:translation initiation factor 5A
MVDEEQFEKTDSGSSHTFPIQCGTLHKGDYVMLKDHPCKLVEITTSKTGKHGHAKASIMGIDIFTKKKYEDSCPTSHSIDAPFVVRKEYQLADIQPDGFMTLLNPDGTTKEDLKLNPEDEEDKPMLEKLQELVGAGKDTMIGVIGAMGQEKAIDFKEMN